MLTEGTGEVCVISPSAGPHRKTQVESDAEGNVASWAEGPVAAFAEVLTSELIAIIYALLPGFFAAWVFYGLTPHPLKTPFERTIQALIFTGLARVVVSFVRWTLLALGEAFAVGIWTADVEFGWSVACGGVVGLIFSFLANTGKLHRLLQAWGITTRTSYPHEWYSVFCVGGRYVYLHLLDGRRLYGWPLLFPDHPHKGHFVLVQAAWILEDNRRVPLLVTEKVLVPARKVGLVELEKSAEDLAKIDNVQHADAERAAVALWNRRSKDGSDEQK